MQDHLVHIQKLYPIVIENEATDVDAFKNGVLLKRELENEYCFIEKTSDVFISFFQSGWMPLNKIEGDYLEANTRFCLSDVEVTRVIMEAMV
tara:strand:- start:3078 stop:3353 length:276 start_codon:yes stop_codon:yes gene_type:complete